MKRLLLVLTLGIFVLTSCEQRGIEGLIKRDGNAGTVPVEVIINGLEDRTFSVLTATVDTFTSDSGNFYRQIIGKITNDQLDAVDLIITDSIYPSTTQFLTDLECVNVGNYYPGTVSSDLASDDAHLSGYNSQYGSSIKFTRSGASSSYIPVNRLNSPVHVTWCNIVYGDLTMKMKESLFYNPTTNDTLSISFEGFSLVFKR